MTVLGGHFVWTVVYLSRRKRMLLTVVCFRRFAQAQPQPSSLVLLVIMDACEKFEFRPASTISGERTVSVRVV